MKPIRAGALTLAVRVPPAEPAAAWVEVVARPAAW
jgi:hypothetical protein